MHPKLFRKAALGFLLVALALILPGVETDSAVAFEWFEECPANMFSCEGYFPLYTAGVCDDGTQTLLVRRTQSGAFCFQTLGL